MPIAISPDLLASLFTPSSASGAFFGQPDPDADKNNNTPQPQPIPNAGATAPQPQPIPPAAATPPVATPVSQTNSMTGQHTDDTDPFTWRPPAGTPAPQSGWDMLHNLIMDKDNQTPRGTTPAKPVVPFTAPALQPPSPPASAMDPTMVAAQRGITTPPAPPAQAYLDPFQRAVAGSKPDTSNLPAVTPVTAPEMSQPTTLNEMLTQSGGSDLGSSTPGPTAKGAIDWGKSQKNLEDASGLHAPIASRPIVPGDRDINPATGKPFTTQEWNDFKAGTNPDTGQAFSSPEEQKAYAKNNNIDLNSFANNHHVLQNLLGQGLEILSEMPARTSAYGGRLGPLPQYLQNQVEQGEQFFNNIAQQKIAAQNYDVNKGSLQQTADMQRAALGAKVGQENAQSAEAIAKAKLTNAQTAQLGGDPSAVDAQGNPLTGQAYMDYIKSRDPNRAALLDKVVNYQMDAKDLFSNRQGGARAALFAEAARIDPNFDETKYANRSALKKSFMSGDDSNTIQTLNTATSHINLAYQLAQAQKNGNVQLVNQIVNQIATATGHPEANNAATAATAVSGELANIFKKSGATDQEIAGIKGTFDPTKMSPDQLQGWLTTAEGLMAGRLGAVNDKWKREFGSDYQGLLSDNSKQILSTLPGGQQILGELNSGNKPAAQGGQPGQAPAAQPGNTGQPQPAAATARIQLPNGQIVSGPAANVDAYIKSHPGAKQLQ